MNKFVKHLFKIAKENGFNSAYAETGRLIYEAEKQGNKFFAHENFSSCRTRAALLISYLGNKQSSNFRHELDVLECIFLQHRYLVHHENKYYDRIQYLYSGFSDYEKSLVDAVRPAPNAFIRFFASFIPGITRGFWSG